jgi:hypothetical protein
MVNTFVWPWKDEEELLEVRQLLYPDVRLHADVQRERQQLGVNIVSHSASTKLAFRFILRLLFF